ncbi:MAG: RNA polymerase sigma factor [Thermoguttaceae bacterium]
MVDWNRLVHEQRQDLLGIAWRILGHAQDAEDVVQEVFGEAHRHSNGAGVVCWPAMLRRMVTCRALDSLRRRRATMTFDAAQPMAGKDDPQAIAAGHELEARLRKALTELAPREAEVFCLRYFDDLSYRAIAETLRISPTAASTALYQARKRLEELLGETD